MEFDLTGIRYRDYIFDSAEGSLNSSDDILGLDRLNLRRKQNELTCSRPLFASGGGQQIHIATRTNRIALNAADAGDFWVADSPSQSERAVADRRRRLNGNKKSRADNYGSPGRISGCAIWFSGKSALSVRFQTAWCM